MPLLELHQDGDTVPNFKLINEELQKVVHRRSILELLDIDDKAKDVTVHHDDRSSCDREISVVSCLIEDAIATSSPQVSYC